MSKNRKESAGAKGYLSSSANNLSRLNGATAAEAEKSVFILTYLKAFTGMTKQRLICRMILYAFAKDPTYARWRDAALHEWALRKGNDKQRTI